MAVLTRAITVSVLFAMLLLMMDVVVFTFHALSSIPVLLGLGLLTLLGSTGLMVRGIISELQTCWGGDSQSEAELMRQGSFLMLLGNILTSIAYAHSTESCSGVSLWLHSAMPSFSLWQTSQMAAIITSTLTFGPMFFVFELDTYCLLFGVVVVLMIFLVWYLGGVTPAAVQQGLVIPSGAWFAVGGIGPAVGLRCWYGYWKLNHRSRIISCPTTKV